MSVFADRVSFVRFATDRSLSAVTISKVKTTWSGEILILASPTTETDGRTDWENVVVTINAHKRVANISFIERLVARHERMVVSVESLTLKILKRFDRVGSTASRSRSRNSFEAVFKLIRFNNLKNYSPIRDGQDRSQNYPFSAATTALFLFRSS